MKRLSRILCLILTVGLLIGSLAVSASADELSESLWFNVMDYVGSYMAYTNAGDNVMTWTLPTGFMVCQIDMVVKFSSPPSAVFYLAPNTNVKALSVVPIGDGNYRIFGTFGPYFSDEIKLNFVFDSSSWLYLQSFYISTTRYTSFDDVCFFGVNGSNYQYMSAPNEQLLYSWGGTQEFSYQEEYTVYLYLQNWKKYDFVDVVFDVRALSVDSIRCVLDDYMIPYEISFLASDGDTWYPDDFQESVNIENLMHTFSVVLRLDLRGIDRSSSHYPCVAVTGMYNLNNASNRFVVRRYSGYIMTDDVNPLFYYFQELRISLTAMFNDLKEALNPSGDNSQGEALKEQGQQMAEYEKQHQDVLQNGVGTLQASSNIGNFATALAFVGNYTTSTFNSLGDYQVVFTLPLVIGLILFLASRAPGHSRPRKTDRSTQHEADRAEKPKNNNSEV